MTSQKHITTLTCLALAGVALTGCDVAISHAAPEVAVAKPADRVERGRYLVEAGGCNDCHTPWKMTPEGPKADRTRLLSGHPEDLAMPPAPVLPPGPWVAVASGSMTAWSGPWGTSFTSNLTPDPTGLGAWTERDFIQTIRTGRHYGVGRPLLPPMPLEAIANYTDEDLGAMFAYLKSIPAVKNRVPAPLPPVTALSDAR